MRRDRRVGAKVGGTKRGWTRSAAALCGLGAVLALDAGPLAAQDREDLVPIVPGGVPVVVLPVQSARATAGGAWPGGAPSEETALEALGAELAFAFADRRGAREWVMPDDVVARVERNPIVRVDPTRLSYQRLLRPPKEQEQLYEPLHGQVRKLAALFGSRLVLLPLAVWFEAEPPAGAPADPTAGERPIENPGSPEGATDPDRGRAVMLLALIDVRRAAVLWHGTLEGGWAEATSPALLATLAQRVARQLAPS